MEKFWRSKTIEIETKKKVLQTYIFSTLSIWKWGLGGDERNWTKNKALREKMLQEGIKNRVDTESEEHWRIQTNTTKGKHHAETDTKKIRTPRVEPSSDGQELEELGEDGIGHIRALSPRLLMMMNYLHAGSLILLHIFTLKFTGLKYNHNHIRLK